MIRSYERYEIENKYFEDQELQRNEKNKNGLEKNECELKVPTEEQPLITVPESQQYNAIEHASDNKDEEDTVKYYRIYKRK